jgi:hypothetical protein
LIPRETVIVVAYVLSIPKLARSTGETACQPRRVLCNHPTLLNRLRSALSGVAAVVVVDRR